MAVQKIASIDVLRRERLLWGATLAGLLGAGKLLLVLAPFLHFNRGGGPISQTYLDFLELAPLDELLSHWGWSAVCSVVPLSALLALGLMPIDPQQPVERSVPRAKWALVFSAASLAVLLPYAWATVAPDWGPGHAVMLWGGWGLVAADVATITLLTAAIPWPERRLASRP